MRFVRRRSVLCVTAVVAVVCLVAAGAEATARPVSVGLVYSSTTATASKPLARATLQGTVMISTEGADGAIAEVTYYLDDATGSRVTSTATEAPFNISTGGIDTTKLQDGRHVLLAVVKTPTETVELFARFTVQNNNTATGTTGTQTPSATPAQTSTTPKVKVGTKEVWKGDFETGDTTQWYGCEADNVPFKCGKGDGKKIKMVNDARQGQWAARFEINSGDTAAGGERVELQNNKAPGPVSKEGDEYWFEWSTKFEPGFKSPTGGWFSILQWHDSGSKPPITVGVAPNSDKIVVTRAGNSQDAPTLGTVRRGQWTDFVLHIKFSKNDSTGFIEGWENGKATLPKYNRSTLITGENYLKMGIYRDRDDSSGTAVVTHDGMRITSL